MLYLSGFSSKRNNYNIVPRVSAVRTLGRVHVSTFSPTNSRVESRPRLVVPDS